MQKSLNYLLIIIIFLGFFLRFIGGNIPFFDDEPDFLVQLNSIDFKNLHLPLAAVGHSPLSLYITKLSSLFFGQTRIGHRFLLILMNTFLIWMIFHLTCQKLGRKEGIFSAFLISVNSFVIYYSREIGCDGYFLFFATLTIYLFYKATETGEDRYMLLWGLTLGLAMLNKSTTIFFLPGFGIYLLINKQRRVWFKKKSFYWSLFISLILISPYLTWLNSNDWSHFRINSHYIQFFNFPISSLIFLGSFLRIGEYPNLNSFGREYMSMLMGVLLFFGVIFTINKSKSNSLIALMQILFWSIIGISVFLFRGWPPHYNVCIVPAVILTASFLNTLWEKQRWLKFLILLFFAFHLLQIPKYLSKINSSYNYHSYLTTHSNVIPQNVNLNIISSALKPLLDKYKPTLVVTPNPQWDTIACYLGAQTRVKTLAPIPLVYDSIEFNPHDWEKVLILDDNLETLTPFISWAKDSSVYNWQTEQEHFLINLDGKKFSFPIVIAFLSIDKSKHPQKQILEQINTGNFILQNIETRSTAN